MNRRLKLEHDIGLVFQLRFSEEIIDDIFMIDCRGWRHALGAGRMLDRYRKPGGFVQLLGLMETCGPAKQEKFLQIIREQDLAWAQALEIRILTIGRIFTWKDTAIAELLPGLPDLTIATAMHGLDTGQREVFVRMLTFSQKRNINDLFDATRPAPEAINAAMQKILIMARKLIAEGRLRLNDVDPDLVVPDDIEERLKKGPSAKLRVVSNDETIDPDDYEPVSETTTLNFDLAKNIGTHVTAAMGAASQAEATTRLEASLRDENMALRRKIISLSNESGALKQDIVRLQMKIEQIRKMAA